jgi:hypothetical protein
MNTGDDIQGLRSEELCLGSVVLLTVAAGISVSVWALVFLGVSNIMTLLASRFTYS